jgi:dolichyl-phosphate-mannose-protein mannosyltransferase
MAGVARLIGYDGRFNFSTVGSHYNSSFFISLRLTPAVFCGLAAPLMTASLLVKHRPVQFAFLVGLFFALDMISVIQSRFILTDGILYFFVAATFFVTSLIERQSEHIILIFLQGFLASCAFCVKFTSAGLFIYIAFSHIRLLAGRPGCLFSLFPRGLLISATFLGFLYGIMALHLRLLPIVGFGDRYFQPNFRSLGLTRRIVLLLRAMYIYSRDLRATHPASSRWFGWPFFLGSPVSFWVHAKQSIVMMNSPVACIASTIGFIGGFATDDWSYSVGYAVSLFPFALIKRVTFCYHYEIPLMFGLMAFAGFLNRVVAKAFYRTAGKVGTLCAVFCFVMLSPFVYGMSREILGLFGPIRG